MRKRNSLLYLYSILPSFLILLFLQGCNIINPAEPVPGYIRIEKFSITPTPALGTDSSKITDVFVYIDAKFQGSYQLPAQFPVIENGEHEMIFFAGIIVNGISNTRTDYPFYDPHQQTVTLEPGKIITINPVVQYADNVVAPWLESFETAALSLVKGSGTAIEIVKLPSGDANNFEGISGAVYLDGSQTHFQVVTDTSYILPKGNSGVFLELNYKCNNSFTVGLVAVSSSSPYSIPIVTLKSKATWNKVYIELESTIMAVADANYFKIYLEAYKESGVTNAEFYFDNFKLLHN
ncbi:MAG TPA: hypothetical protein VJY62_01780 [Bacteroidia bacterium]|nr:hypothetical protein [Bacteroidia bacterium]